MKRRWELLEPFDVPWPLRDMETAVHSIDIDRHGRLVMRIVHAPLAGVSPDDVCWWFGNIGGEIAIGDQVATRYRAWHPLDHIHWALDRPGPNGRAEVGARFHIVEALGRDLGHLVDVVETVTRLDRTGISLEHRVAGLVASTLVHDFGTSPQGTTYRSTLTVGFGVPGASVPVNALVRRWLFAAEMGAAWIKHNVEEVGLLVHLIPMAQGEAT
jgi:hypothetical protein